jgi:transposase
MQTSRSPWTVMRVAHELAECVLPDHASRFSRHDFTLAQLFSCLVVREQLQVSYRKIESILADTDWCRRLGMKRVPDHSTLCRAFRHIVVKSRLGSMLDVMTHHQQRHRQLGKTLAIDSTHYDTHHRSRHYERRCRQTAAPQRKAADSRRSRTARTTPKLMIGVDTASHLILSVRCKAGMGSDAPDFDDLLYAAWRRHDVREVLADAGYDSEANHCIARLDMNVRSWIKTGIGRRTIKKASGRYRRLMQRRLIGSQAGRPYARRAQAETVMSMLKRNLGDSLRARKPHRRKMELMLKAITHNLMIIRCSARVATEPVGSCSVQNIACPAHVR